MIIVRGGGDLATGTIHKLHQCGYTVLVLETAKPTAIRRKAAFSEAVYDKSCTVEGVECRRADTKQQCIQAWEEHAVALMIDPDGQMIKEMQPQALVDAILAKKNLGTKKEMAPLTVALGPGFCAGSDVDYVIETKRGHQLGRVIAQGSALPNTGVPGIIGGYGAQRVIHAPAAGDASICAPFDGVLRGMIRDGFDVEQGLKIADIDPRIGEKENCTTISDKARCIAGGVLEVLVKNRIYAG